MILDKVRQQIARYDKPQYKLNYQRFYKEKLAEPVSIKTQILRKIAKECFRDIKNLPKAEILDCCDRLLESRERYGRFIAVEWAYYISDQYTKNDFRRFETWVKEYVGDWGGCDHLCGGPIGELIAKYPELAPKVKIWAKSKNRWLRRAAAVSLIASLLEGKLLDEAFQVADMLLTDPDDIVQKGFGWMLKQASITFPREVFDYVMERKGRMPRTALRNAIERFPAARRKHAMA